MSQLITVLFLFLLFYTLYIINRYKQAKEFYQNYRLRILLIIKTNNKCPLFSNEKLSDITVMSTRIVFKKDLPEIGKTYNYFDNGNIKESRRAEVLITEIIPFDKIDEETLEFWKDDIEECDHFYTKETDYFIKGDLKIIDEIQKIIFVRTIDGGWFSLGWWAGRLDIDGSLTESLK